ncbi:AAA family ATPase [Roseateles amylovorans]|uniref:ATP-binding protein n=1 Tax=Roseateles amylovorans TaxID=2978473 RepID=A0ABY6B6J3_9BURK|nr:ATP-binding protein [Roseateles amylovorans]UXH79174.1 ATP-binding protein [Roseateles amylovorans]
MKTTDPFAPSDASAVSAFRRRFGGGGASGAADSVSGGPSAQTSASPAAAQHVRLMLFGVIARLVGHCTAGGEQAALAAYPFLADYQAEIRAQVGRSETPWRAWRSRVQAWEADCHAHLPLRALRHAGLSELDLELLLAAGLIEEDPRFAQLFSDGDPQTAPRRPAFGQLIAWWRHGDDGSDGAEVVRRSLLALLRAGLLQALNPEAPRPDWLLTVPHALWDGLRGDPPSAPWLQWRPLESLCPLDRVIADADTLARAKALPALLGGPVDDAQTGFDEFGRVDERNQRNERNERSGRDGQPGSTAFGPAFDGGQGPAASGDLSGTVLLVRGPRHNGRKTLIGGVARAMGRSLLVADAAVLEDESRWRLFGLLAVLLQALPVVDVDLAPGETRALAPLPFGGGTLCVATGRHGAWTCAGAGGSSQAMLTLELPMPDAAQRLRHWREALPGHEEDALVEMAQAARLTSGHVRRVAQTAAALAGLARRPVLGLDDVREACRGLQSARLETLATRLPTRGGLHDLAVDTPTRDEIDALAARCRFRERLAARGAALAQGNAGVRALLAGNSGTGKTLAARLLASSLGKDLYRVDLSATVNKYLGETEKNLHQAFSAAEELDVVLLLDEGDALMAGRTDVGSSNDRYANLETNFLLQRIETFDGILLITTNALDRIDKAFSRRMDVVVHFRPPDEWRRYDILKLHLAAGDEAIGAGASRAHAELGAVDPRREPDALSALNVATAQGSRDAGTGWDALEAEDDIDDDWLQQMACRCTLTGGQLRNVVSHARLLALQRGGGMRTEHLFAALQREYRKTGATCPLRPVETAARVSDPRAGVQA